MDDRDSLKQLETLVRSPARKGHGARLRRALLVLAIPAAATLTTACYGAPMAMGPAADTTVQESGVDCDGDGVADVAQPEQCPATK